MHRDVPLALIAAFVGGTSYAYAQEPFCACVELESTLRALGKLTRASWKDVDEESIARTWPEANPLPCESSPLSGLAGVSAAIERCCGSCGTCGGPVLHADSPLRHGLQSIPISICRRNPDDALSDLRRLVDAAAPESMDAILEEGWSPPVEGGRIYNAYRWRSENDTFILQVFLSPFGEQWYGSFQLARCEAVSAIEEWVLDDGTELAITQVEARDSGQDLWFSYQSKCLLRDYQCLRSEWATLWPRLRSLAEDREATTVFLSAEDCNFGSITVYPKRNTHGDWELPW